VIQTIFSKVRNVDIGQPSLSYRRSPRQNPNARWRPSVGGTS
jgi:hypothetical protein